MFVLHYFHIGGKYILFVFPSDKTQAVYWWKVSNIGHNGCNLKWALLLGAGSSTEDGHISLWVQRNSIILQNAEVIQAGIRCWEWTRRPAAVDTVGLQKKAWRKEALNSPELDTMWSSFCLRWQPPPHRPLYQTCLHLAVDRCPLLHWTMMTTLLLGCERKK